jgi:alkanesulfonate monooxygenase SsuD/methylene tetrahydromethanopterin reductase-like flavin-dependent oxidoreductase (luciferase family)
VSHLDQREPAGRTRRRAGTQAGGHEVGRPADRPRADTRRQLAEHLTAAGHDPAAFPIAAYHSINIGPDPEACLDEAQRFFDNYYGEGMFDRDAAAAMTAVGSPEQCANQLREVIAEGATHVALRMASWSQRQQLELLTDKVLPLLVG